MQRRDIKEILDRYKANSCTEEEKALVEDWVMFGNFPDAALSDAELGEDLLIISKGLPLSVPKKKSRLMVRMAAAAGILLIAAFGLYFMKSGEHAAEPAANNLNDIPPGGNKAVLTLENGEKISLDDANNGKLAEQAGISITKTQDGQLTYTMSNAGTQAKKTGYNTIETPRGGQYQVILPDGSKVWLNSGSSLRFPAIFEADKRIVQLKGEAYFEIKHDERPFRVRTDGQQVEVLGTHFNINSYSDETFTKTTLLEGSIKITTADESFARILVPGEQALQQSDVIKVSQVDTDAAVAWKNGLFIFDDESLETIMRSLARWYEIEVVYGSDVNKSILFGGSVSRYENVSKVLEKLELTGGVHFKIEERRVTVMK